LSILSARICDSSVERGIPNRAAAPEAPNTRPPLARRASSTIAFSCDASVLDIPRRFSTLGWVDILFVILGLASWRTVGSMTPPRSQKMMLAVLPFENLTGDPSKEYLADGLTEETISQLGRLNPEQLDVIARTSVMGYKHKAERLDRMDAICLCSTCWKTASGRAAIRCASRPSCCG
jgi:hypothetical protein